MDVVTEYINDNWQNTVRFSPEDNGTLIGLPYPYIVPCARNRFQELYYWDTYFGCRGLALSGQYEMVLNNLRNFFYELEKFGFIPNGSRSYYLNRSQPPFLGALIKLVLELFPEDKDLKKQSYLMLKKEILFWDSHRKDAQSGLYHYGSDPTEEDILDFYKLAEIRRGIAPADNEAGVRAIGLDTLAQAESGWDFTGRFEGKCPDCAAIDLNSLLFLSLNVLAELALFADEDGRIWLERAGELKKAVHKYCRKENGIFTDYFFDNCKQAEILSAASFYPLWTDLADRTEALAVRNTVLAELEYPAGIAATEKIDKEKIQQWEFPNGWPCLQMIAMESLAKYGFTKDALRIAEKYVSTVRKNFEKTNNLWEKYNVIDGSTRVAAEYEMPAMMGWTAGTYLVAQKILSSVSE